jgi:hypothetical protein
MGEAGSPRPLQRCVVMMLTTRPYATLAAAGRQIAACGKVIWLWACILRLRIFAAAALRGPAGPVWG